ncbi:MAG: LysE/ArgO family amino acid transporter [Cryobacterium sp.]|uniref:LysE/ArgO family amino acid transporter n=1 Tax=unclassified Cryobacterium TaxID=2649013 RepID=UPI0018CA778B|nr:MULTISPECIES: LysE/ArgO family amino acid transporter [unclassified Cryobacterium]MCY7403387.1 LysE/ArgO family amino acid transporter [Cryobacterium sp.]
MHLAETLLPALFGILTGLALIVAIGSQNAFILRLGIEAHNRTVLVAVLICAVSDAVLILAGILGIGALVGTAPALLIVVQVAGVGFLLSYGVFAAVRVFRPKNLVASASTGISAKVAVTTTIALTWLNPHVYLDTVVFLGSVANQQGAAERWWWGGGAVVASFLWFFALGFGARMLRPFFAKPGSWRILDGFIAVVMITLGVRMAIGI